MNIIKTYYRNNDNVKVTATGLNEAVFCGTTTDLENVIPELHNDGKITSAACCCYIKYITH